jgi:hypothetical protein
LSILSFLSPYPCYNFLIFPECERNYVLFISKGKKR